MSEIRKNPEKEISALAALNDSDIDTDAIPEIRDWSDALQGRFCRLNNKQVTVLLGPELIYSPSDMQAGIQPPSVASVAAVDYAQMDSRQLVAELLMKKEAAAEEFARRFRPLIAATIIKVSRRWNASPSIMDDLVQEVFLKILTLGSRIWKDFQPVHESSVHGMIRVLTANVALDYFRMHHAVKRGSSGTVVLESASAPELGASAETLDRHILLTELDQGLKGKITSRDRTIYWLHYHQGFSAMKIAQLPDVGLTAKGVESVLSRITKLMRSELNLRHNL